ncbi:MAG TPA: DUF3300 domain-containing protein [Candidatus Tectomicrobia bacterium]|nr:DUF3300 domain-containing protein [Candidatus Tectomicrobia bacterium]
MRNHTALSVTGLLFGIMLCACATTESTSQGTSVTSASAVMTTASSPPAAAQGSPQAAIFRTEELEQLVAPIALYPDALLAQVLMASTYPLEIVSAARWVKANPNLKEQALEDALQTETWDPSVKSLTAFPQVLTMMNDKLDWTQKLGDAFLAQQKDVMDAVQALRIKAQAQGHLQTTPEQKVIVEQPAGSQTTVVKIEPASPQVVHVPTYNPTVVYGAWPYPAYPPYYYYPPGYVAATSIFSFGVGVAVGSALWGGYNWHGGDVDIDVNKYNNFNKANISSGKWEHNVEHRKGVQYRDTASQQKYNRTTRTGGDARETFRGRAESGRQELARSGAEGGQRDLERGRAGAERRDTPGASRTSDRQVGQERRESGVRERQGIDRGREPAAFQGMGQGREVRRDSERGLASRQSAAASRASFSGGGRSGGAGGGGFGRAGGGRGGGRGR